MEIRSGSGVLAWILVGLCSGSAWAQESPAPPKPAAAAPSEGLQIATEDGRFAMELSARFQFRYTHELVRDEDDALERLSSFRVRRARLKVGGHGFQPWFKYYFEYDLPSNTLLDWRVSLERFEALRLRFGQWKIEYNRERVDSSGKQQLVDRSIVNPDFNLDRQVGVELYGSVLEKTPGWLDYHLGVFTGTGINEPENDDAHLLWLARLQWNFLGRGVKFSQSDFELTERPTAAIGVSAATNRTNRTRFPQTKNLGDPGQYRIDSLGEDFVFRYRGLFVQQEFHLKRVTDRKEDTVRNSRGGYVQVGVVPHAALNAIPRPLELAGRVALVDPDLDRPEDLQRELTVGANWFFSGHENKLTADFSRVLDESGGSESLARVQWDVSF